jgi:hypothetical protein
MTALISINSPPTFCIFDDGKIAMDRLTCLNETPRKYAPILAE